MLKELKIVFINEENINDAGGLLREWIHIISEKIVDPSLGLKIWENNYFIGLFKLSDSDDVFYKFNTEKEPTEKLI